VGSAPIIEAGARWLAGQARSNTRVAVTGFCLGGAMTLAAACNIEGLGAAVPFYGTPKDEYANGWRAKAPILGHYAKNDGFVSIERARAVAAMVNANGGSFELHEYDAGHAFMREADPTAYHAPSADLAWARTITFLNKHLSV
jgi:carboxymethylenebutenolidase